MGLTVSVRGIESARWDVWEVLVHALGADAMAEIQRAVLHQESFNRLPEPFPVADGFAVTASGDQPFSVMHLTELIHQSKGSASEFQKSGGLFRQAFHHLVLRIGE